MIDENWSPYMESFGPLHMLSDDVRETVSGSKWQTYRFAGRHLVKRLGRYR